MALPGRGTVVERSPVVASANPRRPPTLKFFYRPTDSMTSPPLARSCHNHPDRPAVAVCVSCREPICPSCSTLWEGMHHCVDCLAERRAAVARRGTVLPALVLVALSIALLFAITHLRAMVDALLAGRFS